MQLKQLFVKCPTLYGLGIGAQHFWDVRSHSYRQANLTAGAGAARASVVSLLCKDAPDRPGGAREERAFARLRSARRHVGRGAASGASCPSATAGASILSVVLCKDAPNRLGSAIEQRALARRRSSRRRGRRGRRQWLRVVAPLHAAPLASVSRPAQSRRKMTSTELQL